MRYAMNSLWFLLGILGVFMSFWSGKSGIPSFTRAVRAYWTEYQRIAIFNLFAYVCLVLYWLQYGIGQYMKQGELTVLVVPLAWTAGTLFHVLIKNFAAMVPGIIGRAFGVTKQGGADV